MSNYGPTATEADREDTQYAKTTETMSTPVATDRYGLTAPEAFFYRHAGFSHDPKTQSPTEGRVETARALAYAERQASEAGYGFAWERDSDSDHGDAWQCMLLTPEGRFETGISDVDLGEGQTPWTADSHSYRRVTEAELAAELFPWPPKPELSGDFPRPAVSTHHKVAVVATWATGQGPLFPRQPFAKRGVRWAHIRASGDLPLVRDDVRVGGHGVYIRKDGSEGTLAEMPRLRLSEIPSELADLLWQHLTEAAAE